MSASPALGFGLSRSGSCENLPWMRSSNSGRSRRCWAHVRCLARSTSTTTAATSSDECAGPRPSVAPARPARSRTQRRVRLRMIGMEPSLATPPLFAALEPARRVLLAGAGGGFDVYAGLPLALALWDRGVEVHLANLSFAPLELVPPELWLEPNVAAVTPEVARDVPYFPELALAHWLAEQ